MNHLNSNEKIIQLLLDNLYPISNSVNTILDNLIKIINEEVSEDELKKISIIVLEQLDGILPSLITLDKEVPIKDAEGSSDEVILMYHSAMKHILQGFKILLDWLKKEEDAKDELHLAIDNLFEGVQLTVNLVNKIL